MILDQKINFPYILGYLSLHPSSCKNAFRLTESDKYFFYEFLNFRAVSAGAIAFQSAKIANIDRTLEKKHLAQKA